MVLRTMSAAVLCCMVGVVSAQPYGGPGSGMGGMHGDPDTEKMPGRRGGPGLVPPGMMGPDAHRGLDSDGDGLISREEVRQQERVLQQMREQWQRADRDGDGMLDQAEFAAFQQQLRQGAPGQ